MTDSLRESAITALKRAFDRCTEGAPRDVSGYADRLRDNLLPGVTEDLFFAEYDRGSGNEVSAEPPARPKMCALYSSAALVVNSFARWKEDLSALSLRGIQGFEHLEFEAKCPTGLRGTPPHLDVLLEAPAGVVAIESKCLEYLSTHPADFKKSYDSISDGRARSPWYRQIAALRGDPTKYRFLDAAQLIKHYLGLSHTFADKPITFLYLFWEPANPEDFDEFAAHRAEFIDFRKAVAGSSVRLEAMSYPELWREWSARPEPAWLPAHVRGLRERYEVEI